MIRKNKKLYTIEDSLLYIDLPAGADSIVRPGVQVKKGDTLFKSDDAIILESHYLPKALGIPVDKGREYIGRISGQFVNTGDLIGERVTAGGIMTKRILAGVDGIVTTNRIDKGYLDILSESNTVHRESPADGVVESVIPGRYMIIKTMAQALPFTIHHNLDKAVHHVESLHDEEIVSGKLTLLGDGTSIYSEKDLKENYAGEIVVAGRFLYPELARTLYMREASVVIAYAMDYFDYRELEVPVIILGGFGQIASGMKMFDALTEYKNSYVEIDVEKKRVLIYSPELNHATTDENDDHLDGFVGYAVNVEVGDKVRSFDSDSFGMFGMVVEVDDSTDLPLLIVEKSDGSRFVVPTTSVEIVD